MDAELLLKEAFPFLLDLLEEWKDSMYIQDEDRVFKLDCLVEDIRSHLKKAKELPV